MFNLVAEGDQQKFFVTKISQSTVSRKEAHHSYIHTVQPEMFVRNVVLWLEF